MFILKHPRPIERLKVAEKSTDEDEVKLVEQHASAVLQWGDLPVYQGCIDTVTKFLGTETSSSRQSRGTKIAKDVKRLMACLTILGPETD